MNSARNLFILGVGVFMGLSVPAYAEAPKYAAGGPVATGSAGVDGVLNALLRSGAAVSLILTVVLDSTVPAAPGERGLGEWHGARWGGRWWDDPELLEVYGLPWGLTMRWVVAREAVAAWMGARVCGQRRQRAGGGGAVEEGDEGAVEAEGDGAVGDGAGDRGATASPRPPKADPERQ